MYPTFPIRPRHELPRKEGRAHEAIIPRSIAQETEERMSALDRILADQDRLSESELDRYNEEYDRLEALQKKLAQTRAA